MKVDALENTAPDNTALVELFTRLEFKSWLEELLGGGEAPATSVKADADYEVVTAQSDFEAGLS